MLPHQRIDPNMSDYRLHRRLVALTVFITTTVQGHHFDLDVTTSRDHLMWSFSLYDVNNSTWLPPTSVNVALLPVNELRATVADRKQIAVQVGVDELAPPRGRTTNYDNATEHGIIIRRFADYLHKA